MIIIFKRKQVVFLFCFFVILSFFQVKPTTFASGRGYWKKIDFYTEHNVQANVPYQVEKKGDGTEFDLILEDKDNQAIMHWSFTPPPIHLIPGIYWKYSIKGLIKEWGISKVLSSTLMIRFQPYGSDCCDAGSVVVARSSLSPGSGDKKGVEKVVSDDLVFPTLGDYNSQRNKKLQIRFNVIQAGGDFQWVYVYQWIEGTPEIEILMRISNKEAQINKQQYVLDSPPFIENGRTYAPFRFIGEAFGAFVDFNTDPKNGKTKEVIYVLNKETIIIDLFNQVMKKNGIKIQDFPPVIIRNNRLMVPIRIISENLGAKVIWNAEKQEVRILRLW